MYRDTIWHFEVIAGDDLSRREDAHDGPFARKASALKRARELAHQYKRVEVVAVEVAIDDPGNLHGDELVAAFENGKRTA